MADLVIEGGEARLKEFVHGGHPLSLRGMVNEMARLGPDLEPPIVDWGPDVGEEFVKD